MASQKNELDFDSLLMELSDNSNTLTKGGYKFQELTMKEQRKILNMGFNPIEIPARIENIFNEYIKVGVKNTDSIIDILDEVTIDLKPFMIVQLRNLTLGNVYVDSKTKKKYTLYDITDEDLSNPIEPIIINFNNFIIRLEVPTLNKETSVNGQLLVELGNFKKNLSESDYGKVADLYQVYELMKYITEIELNGQVFNFERCPVNKKNKIINSLPQRVIAQINDYIEKVKQNEEKALTMVAEDGSTSVADISTIFFVRNAREKK